MKKMTMKKNRNTKLKALSCAALSLPGMLSQDVMAEAAPDKHTLSYRYTSYGEGAQEEHAFSTPEAPDPIARYDISVHQFLASGPITSGKAYNVTFGAESMSGASPMLITPELIDGEVTADSKPRLIMSGASIEEQRFDGSLGFDIYEKTSKLGFGGALSVENDYSSLSFSVNHSSWFNDKNTTLDIATGISFDTIEPTDADLFLLRPTEEKKQSMSASIGLSHVINKKLLLGTSANYVVYNGYMSDPYKQVHVHSLEDQIIADSRPDVRKQAALNLQARYFISPTNSALHADYRYFSTDWGTVSHTINLAWFQNFGSWQVIPRLRFYNQTAANFYRNYYVVERADGYYSSDYRLSAYDAISFRIKGQKAFGPVNLHLSYELYDSFSSDTDPQRGENPALVNFSFFSLGADYRF